MHKIRKRVLKGTAAVLCIAAAAVSSFSCKEIGLRNYIIDKVVGLEEIALDTPTINNDTPTITWEEVQDAEGYRYQWDAVQPDNWIETTDNYFVQEESLSDGEHTLYLQVKNAEGLWSPIYSFVFYIDQELTDPPIVTGPETTTELRPTWTWNKVEGAVRYAYQLDSKDNDGYTGTSARSYTPASDLSLGNHRLYVRAQNSGGKWSGWGAHTVTITEDSTGGGPTDTTPPSVESHTPGTNDAVPSVPIIVSFSEAMNTAAAEDAFSLVGPAPLTDEVSGTFAWSEGGTVMTFVPASDLTEGSSYTYSLSTAAADPAGNPLTAGIGDTEFEVVGLFESDYEIDSVANQDLRALTWNDNDEKFACVYNSTDGLRLKVFSDPASPGTAETGFGLSYVNTGNADIAWNGFNYGVVAVDKSTGAKELLFFEINSSGSIVGAGVSMYYDDSSGGGQSGIKYLNDVSIAWDPMASKWGITWCQDIVLNDGSSIDYGICFTTLDTDGTNGTTPEVISGEDNEYTVPNLFWMENQFGVTTAQYPSNAGYFISIPTGDNGSGASMPVSITTDNIVFGMRGAWNGSKLGIVWIDWGATHSYDIKFAQLNKSGSISDSVTVVENSDSDNDYENDDFMDIAWNGSRYGVLWSRTGSFNEIEWVTLSDDGGNWDTDNNPITITGSDGVTSRNPRIVWNGSKWCAGYDNESNARVQFIY